MADDRRAVYFDHHARGGKQRAAGRLVTSEEHAAGARDRRRGRQPAVASLLLQLRHDGHPEVFGALAEEFEGIFGSDLIDPDDRRGDARGGGRFEQKGVVNGAWFRQEARVVAIAVRADETPAVAQPDAGQGRGGAGAGGAAEAEHPGLPGGAFEFPRRLTVAYRVAAQVEEHAMERDADGADFGAAAAEAGGEGQVGVAAVRPEERREHGADRAHVGRPVGEAAGRPIDRAAVHASAAADALQHLAVAFVLEDARTAVIHEDHMALLAGLGVREEVGERGERLGGRAGGQHFEDGERRRLIGDKLLHPGDRDVQLRVAHAERDVALVFDDADAPAGGDHDVRAADPRVALLKEVADNVADEAREPLGVIVGKVGAGALEKFADARAVEVQGGGGDVARAAPFDIDDVLADVGLQEVDPGGAQGVRQAHLFADHRFRLGHTLRIAEEGEDDAVGLAGGGGAVVADAAAGEVQGHLGVQLVQVVDGVGAGSGGARPGIAWAALEHRGGVSDQLPHDRRDRGGWALGADLGGGAFAIAAHPRARERSSASVQVSSLRPMPRAPPSRWARQE